MGKKTKKKSNEKKTGKKSKEKAEKKKGKKPAKGKKKSSKSKTKKESFIEGRAEREERIRSLAFSKWEQAGYPHGQDIEFWFLAEREIAENDTSVSKL